MTWLKKLTLSCALVPLGACTMLTNQPVAMAAAPVKAAPAQPTATPAMWVVKDDDTTIYMLGKVHVLKPDVVWFTGGVRAAFDRSDTMVLEMVMPDDPAALAGPMMAKAVDPSGTALTSRLSADDAAAYRAAMDQYGIDPAQFEGFQPWFGAIFLAMMPVIRAGHSPTSGVEAMLTEAAKASGKPITGLETAEQQFGFMAGLPMDAQVRWLNDTVRLLPEVSTQFDALMAMWSAGQAEQLGAMINEQLADSPELAAALIHDRNARWATWIKARLDQPGTVFLAVGAGHLAGDNSVQDYLTQQGVTAVRQP